jgi:hypothetical protein
LNENSHKALSIHHRASSGGALMENESFDNTKNKNVLSEEEEKLKKFVISENVCTKSRIN